jgi:outer membrane protein TolC
MIVGHAQGWRLLLSLLFVATHLHSVAAQAPDAGDREQALPAPKPLLPVEKPADDRFPIDLATTLRLAGANNLQIAVASERVRQAQARLEGAKVLWLPSLNLGVGYNRHEGQIQDTRGDVIDVRRSSAFVGGGAKVGSAPLAGGSNGPAPFFVSLSLADAIFAPLSERQLVKASDAARAATFNDTLLETGLGYLELVRSQARFAIALEAVTNAQELVRLIEARVKAGTAPPADELRARAELAERQRQVLQAEEAVHDVSAELVRLLRLEPATVLAPLEGQPMPVILVPPDQPLPDLLAQGVASRPELAEHQALVNATLARL